MPTALALRHVHVEDLGAFAAPLQAASHQLRTLDADVDAPRPQGADGLASTPPCAHQAFAVGRHALGLQFHPEADGAGFERWLIWRAVETAAGRCCLAEWLGGLPR